MRSVGMNNIPSKVYRGELYGEKEKTMLKVRRGYLLEDS